LGLGQNFQEGRVIAPVFYRALDTVQRNRMMNFFANPGDTSSAQLLSCCFGGHSTDVLSYTLLESFRDFKSRN